MRKAQSRDLQGDSSLPRDRSGIRRADTSSLATYREIELYGGRRGRVFQIFEPRAANRMGWRVTGKEGSLPANTQIAGYLEPRRTVLSLRLPPITRTGDLTAPTMLSSSQTGESISAILHTA